MDDRAQQDEQPEPPGADGQRVGLGRVVVDRLAGARERRAGVEAPTSGVEGASVDVEQASEESFPASDPPTWMSEPTTPRDRSPGGEPA